MYTDIHAHPELSMQETRTAGIAADHWPAREQTGPPDASTRTATDRAGKTVPVMHAGGHDMPVTWLMGAAQRAHTGKNLTVAP